MTKQDDMAELMDMLRMTAPGTHLRDGLDDVLRANTGGLIVIGDPNKIEPLAVGGFNIDASYSPAQLYELAKMDGAIILTEDCSRISRANVHLNPNPTIPTGETGIRHRTAEQTARQTGELVISISQRRHLITLFKGSTRYVLRDTSTLLNTANQAVETLDKYKSVLMEALLRLSIEEFDDIVNLEDVLQVIQRAEMFNRVENELRLYITELGSESRLIKMQAEELISNVDFEERLTLRDYIIRDENKEENEQIDTIINRLRRMSNEDLLDIERLSILLGYEGYRDKNRRVVLPSRGYRLLHKIPRLPSSIINNVVEHFKTLQVLLTATTEELDEVEGIGPVRAQQIITGLERLRARTIAERYWS